MSHFVANPSLTLELLSQLRPVLRASGEAVASRADSFAHSAMPRRGYKRIEVHETVEGVEVANTNYGGHLEEFGSVNNPPYAPLRRGARAVGLKLRES